MTAIELSACSEETKARLARRVADLDLSARATHAFRGIGIVFVGDLVQWSEARLSKLRNLGRKSISEIKSKLPMGLSLGTSIDGWTAATGLALERDLRERIDALRQKDAEELLSTIGKAESVEAELSRLVEAYTGGSRQADVVKTLFGWDGTGRKTLEQTGRRFGITRERVRQIAAVFEKRLRTKIVPTPLLRAAMSTIDEQVPATWSSVEKTLRQRGILRSSFHPSGFLSAADLTGHKPAFEITFLDESVVVTRRGQSELAHSIVSIARRMVSRVGCSTMDEVADSVSARKGRTVEPDYAKLVLQREPDWSPLDDRHEWFWLNAQKRNRLLNQLRKIFAVAEVVPVGELRAAVSRHHRMNGFAPPIRVLTRLLSSLQHYKVENGYVSCSSRARSEDALGQIETHFYHTLRDHDGVMTREQLENELLGAGMNSSTFQVYLSNSPIIVRLRPRVYALVGAHVAPGKVDALARARSDQPARVDHGWTASGSIWIAYRLNYGILSSGVVTLPVALRDLLQGEFRLASADGGDFGDLKARNGFVWGLGRFFRRRGGEVGDYMLLVFSLSPCSATVEIGNEAVLEILTGNRHEAIGLSKIARAASPSRADDGEAAEPIAVAAVSLHEIGESHTE